MITRFSCILFILIAGIALTSQAQSKYVGVNKCAMCHKLANYGNQYAVWEKSKHAEAYNTLTGAKAAEIAKAKGIKNAAEAPECLECHGGVDAKLADKTYDVKKGVQCEGCHGPGSAYLTLNVMKDKAKSIQAGVREFKDKAAKEALCKTCHNEKSPSFKGFKYDEMWAKIKHGAPQKG